MATNFFFNNFKSSQEQQLLENLIIESIQIYGEDMVYIPRIINNYDSIYGADDQSSYSKWYPLEIYIKSVDGFGGDGSFMSKFGLEIRDQVIFSVAQRRFNDEVGSNTKQPRPNEGDLIYFPLNNKCFQIKFVNKFEMFYQLGTLQTWEMTCELFEYSSEQLNTGIAAIDNLQQKFDLNQTNWTIDTQDGFPILTQDGDYIVLEGADIKKVDAASDNEELQREAAVFVDFTTLDPFSEGNL